MRAMAGRHIRPPPADSGDAGGWTVGVQVPASSGALPLAAAAAESLYGLSSTRPSCCGWYSVQPRVACRRLPRMPLILPSSAAPRLVLSTNPAGGGLYQSPWEAAPREGPGVPCPPFGRGLALQVFLKSRCLE